MDLPGKDVLRMVVAQVDLGRTTDGYTFSLVVVDGQQIRFCRSIQRQP